MFWIMKEMSLIDKKVFMFEFRLLRKPAHSCPEAHKWSAIFECKFLHPLWNSNFIYLFGRSNCFCILANMRHFWVCIGHWTAFSKLRVLRNRLMLAGKLRFLLFCLHLILTVFEFFGRKKLIFPCKKWISIAFVELHGPKLAFRKSKIMLQSVTLPKLWWSQTTTKSKSKLETYSVWKIHLHQKRKSMWHEKESTRRQKLPRGQNGGKNSNA